MFNKKFTTVILFLIISTSQILSQNNGNISGKVFDKNTNEILIGASVLIVGTNYGASTDLDGNFLIRNIPAGKYNLRVSYISYQTLNIQDVNVEAKKTTTLNISLESITTELNEVLITAEALKSTEASILSIQKNSLNIVDGLSAELIKKNNNSDGADVLKRMTGVTISEGKYAFVRGVGDRYNNTMLNGSNLPSTDPEKKSFAYDIFPASLIENVLTSKTYIPDKPADFVGGLVEINTVEFPSRFIFDVSSSAGLYSKTTFQEFTSYNGGKKDYLGFDDGTRSLPSIIPNSKLDRTYSQEDLQKFGLAFSNNWQTKTYKSPINRNFKINHGNQILIGDDIIGYIASLSYSSDNQIKELEQASYTYEGPRYQYNGVSNVSNISWGALFNVSYKSGDKNKISIKNVYNQNADDETTIYEGAYTSYLQHRKTTAFRYISRSLMSSQVIGNHYFDLLNGLQLEWNINYSNAKRNEPDARRYVYARSLDVPEEKMKLLLDPSLLTRYYGNLDDNNYGTNLGFTLKPFVNPNLPKFKFGYNFDFKKRNFNARIFGFRNLPGGNFIQEENLLYESIDKLFAPQNFNSTFLEITEITQPTDSYSANQYINAFYLMIDFQPDKSVKVVTGLRYENAIQKLNSKSRTGDPIIVDSKYNDVFPSLNITYQPIEKINLRFALSRTIARPEFREIAPFTYFDFVANELVIGNTKLNRSLITNYDIRFEYYPTSRELLSVSAFYKKLMNPIEQILISSSALEPIRSYENSKTASNYGLEFELRKNLDFVSSMLNNFSMIGNLSFIKSKILLVERGFQESSRPLQGQSDFILNLGLYYDNLEENFSASIIYNKVGKRISKVGFGGLGDVIELPRDQIDFGLSFKLINQFSLKISVKDILAQNVKFIQLTPNGEKPAEIEKRGQTLSIGLTYNL